MIYNIDITKNKLIFFGTVTLVIIVITLLIDPRVTGVFVTLTIAVITWSLNEWSKRKNDEYKQRETTYLELLKNLSGFYSHSIDEDESIAIKARQEVINQLGLCWLYASDEVINKAAIFLDAVKSSSDEQENSIALGSLILAIRKDLIGKTELKPELFISFIVSPSKKS